MADILTDPLLNLRRSIANGTSPVPTTSTDASSASDATSNLAIATHLHFFEPDHQAYPLSTPTRFISSDKPVDLRSIYFAWLKKDVAIGEYVTSTQNLDKELAASEGAGGTVQHLVFVERLDLITWLEGASDDSEYITPLAGSAEQAAASADVASGAAGGAAALPGGQAISRPVRNINPRLQEIYNGERRMGDRNTVLRGIKPTDFSHVRKSAEVFLSRSRPRPNGPTAPTTGGVPTQTANLVSLPKKASRRPDPIILLSPSASSLLRMSNIKSFLENGHYMPPDTTTSTTILHISRLLPTVDPTRPLRFILVDSPEHFKPDYWNRVVAVFTTGQTWQFKSYKWQSPPELFKHVLGVYLGWRGEEVPASVRSWGRGVVTMAVEKWHKAQGESARWRDREVVEGIWGCVEEGMRARGWGKEGGVGTGM